MTARIARTVKLLDFSAVNAASPINRDSVQLHDDELHGRELLTQLCNLQFTNSHLFIHSHKSLTKPETVPLKCRCPNLKTFMDKKCQMHCLFSIGLIVFCIFNSYTTCRRAIHIKKKR